MSALVSLARLVVARERRAFLRGFALSVLVLAMGVALLGVSGWFITAAAAAGLAGMGILFNVFIPSGMVRFLAMGRMAARYGERLLTHDATLRALTALRIRLLRGLLDSPWRGLERLRANSFLNRVTADVDALDGVLLRLILPGISGTLVILGTGLALWALVDGRIAALVAGGYLLGPTAVFLLGQRIARGPARRAEAAMQASRTRLVDLIAGREDLVMQGQLPVEGARLRDALDRQARARADLDGIERTTGFGLDLIGGAITAGALALGAHLAQAGAISPAQAAVGVFAALALAEGAAPVRRALAEIGRMVQAARRVLPAVAPHPPADPAAPAQAADLAADPTEGLELQGVTLRSGTGRALFAPLDLSVAPGAWVALTGASGLGKSSVLLMVAGALDPSAGRILWQGRPVTATTEAVMVSQRHALIAGSIADNLRLADPEASEAALWQVLEVCALDQVIAARGGLGSRLGPRGDGLSGGEARRLVLARALLRAPELLLLDEPTEGLDTATAVQVLAGLRRALPRTTVLMAAHRRIEQQAADQTVALCPLPN